VIQQSESSSYQSTPNTTVLLSRAFHTQAHSQHSSPPRQQQQFSILTTDAVTTTSTTTTTTPNPTTTTTTTTTTISSDSDSESEMSNSATERIKRFLISQWFMIGVVIVINLARLAPWVGLKGGPIKPEITIKKLAVSLIFFNSGLCLPTKELKAAVFQVKLHAFVQLTSMAVAPLVMATIVSFVRPMDVVHPSLLDGLLVVSCMPPPVSSAVILTKEVGGNEAAAIFNSTLGSFVGIVLTPMLLLWVVGLQAKIHLSSVMASMGATVVFPLFAGQMLQQVLGHESVASLKKRIPFSKINSCVLLMIIYHVFCDTFAKDVDIEFSTMAAAFTAVIGWQLLFLRGTFLVASQPMCNFTGQDVVTIMFTSTHKSLTLGMPMINLLYGSDPRLLYISLPLLIYHPSQILIGSTLVPTLRRWITRHKDVHESGQELAVLDNVTVRQSTSSDRLSQGSSNGVVKTNSTPPSSPVGVEQYMSPAAVASYTQGQRIRRSPSPSVHSDAGSSNYNTTS
jgi:solute carrier family 10 (sodium/bile acid cotransporter), member 7